MFRKLIFITLLLSFTVIAQAAPDGKALFARDCSVCHGEHGHGGVGVPLDLPSFINSVSNEFLIRTIRSGRPGRVMPAFVDLSDAEVGAIAAYIRTWGTKPEPKRNNAVIKGDVAKGKKLFASHCARCHGKDGKGGEGTGVTFSRKRDLPIMPPGLNNSGFLGAATDTVIKNTIMHGRKGTPMSAVAAAGLSEVQINDLVAYIRSFAKQAPGPKPTHESNPDIIVDSPYSLEETVENVKMAITNQNFILIRTDYLDHGLVKKGHENKNEVVLHFCNFSFLYKALAIDPRVGLFLPCRVTVVKIGNKVKVMAINPSYLSKLYNNDELNEACKHMYKVYTAILNSAVE